MRCIFCKTPSASCRSVEHIIPESLGNKEHLLPPGVVCDACNNYFARKIEAPLLGGVHFQNMRGRQLLPNKRGLVPPQIGIHAPSRIEVELNWLGPNDLQLGARRERDETELLRSLATEKRGSLYIPTSWEVDKRLIGRFIGKVGLEEVAQRTLSVEGWNDEIVDNPQLDVLRAYVRRNEGQTWPIHQRQIYDEDHAFDGDQVVHEYDILVTADLEFYSVVCIFGTEYVLNLGGPDLEGYHRWLAEHNYASPLYRGQ